MFGGTTQSVTRLTDFVRASVQLRLLQIHLKLTKLVIQTLVIYLTQLTNCTDEKSVSRDSVLTSGLIEVTTTPWDKKPVLEWP